MNGRVVLIVALLGTVAACSWGQPASVLTSFDELAVRWNEEAPADLRNVAAHTDDLEFQSTLSPTLELDGEAASDGTVRRVILVYTGSTVGQRFELWDPKLDGAPQQEARDAWATLVRVIARDRPEISDEEVLAKLGVLRPPPDGYGHLDVRTEIGGLEFRLFRARDGLRFQVSLASWEDQVGLHAGARPMELMVHPSGS